MPLKLGPYAGLSVVFCAIAGALTFSANPAFAYTGHSTVSVVLSGVINSPQGKPQAGAFIGLGPNTATTDAQGKYSISVQPSSSVSGFIWAPDAKLEHLTYNLSWIQTGSSSVQIQPIQLLNVFSPTFPASLSGLAVTSGPGAQTVHIHGWSKYPLNSSVFVTRPSGWVHRYPLNLSGQKYSANIPFGPSGRYDLELLASNGLQLFDVPVFHGVKKPTPPTGPSFAPAPRSTDQLTLALYTVGLVNQVRTSKGLATFTMPADLRRAAYLHTVDMARNGYYYSHPHVGSDGSTLMDRLQAAGAECDSAAEDISGGATIGDAIDTLVLSPAHLLAFEQNYTRAGVGLAHWRGNWILTIDMCR